MKPLFLLLFIVLFTLPIHAQMPVLVLDSYSPKKIRIYEGETIYFRLKGDKRRYVDEIVALRDSSVVLKELAHAIPLKDFYRFYFPIRAPRNLGKALHLPALGFLSAALVRPLMPTAYYDGNESFVIGTSLLVTARTLLLFKYKKFTINKNKRIRIMVLPINQKIN